MKVALAGIAVLMVLLFVVQPVLPLGWIPIGELLLTVWLAVWAVKAIRGYAQRRRLDRERLGRLSRDHTDLRSH